MKEECRNPVNLHHSTCKGLFNGGESVTEKTSNSLWCWS